VQTITINGRFLGQPLSGVQRFARELTLSLDRRIAAGAMPMLLRDVASPSRMARRWIFR
jgi:hypothetical protein